MKEINLFPFHQWVSVKFLYDVMFFSSFAVLSIVMNQYLLFLTIYQDKVSWKFDLYNLSSYEKSVLFVKKNYNSNIIVGKHVKWIVIDILLINMF